MKVGDLVKFKPAHRKMQQEVEGIPHPSTGIVLSFPETTPRGIFPKVYVFTSRGLELWVMRFCEVINESR